MQPITIYNDVRMKCQFFYKAINEAVVVHKENHPPPMDP